MSMSNNDQANEFRSSAHNARLTVDATSGTRYDQGMKRWLRFSLWAAAALTGFVIIIFVAFVWLLIVPWRSYKKIGGRWSSATETPLIAESGRKPKYLVRSGVFIRKTVAEDITSFHYLGDDCIVYTVAGYGQDEMYARCADHHPVFLDHVTDHQKISMVSDPLQLNGTTMEVVEVKRRAIQGISNPR
jgi:hypothetical protein